jgi:predicted component of type VI protein secretion system
MRPGTQRLVELVAQPGRLTVGRGSENQLALPWDAKVSRVHCELERLGGEWAINDAGLSRNGTFVNEQRLTERRRLREGDVIRVGSTRLTVRGLEQRPSVTAGSESSGVTPPLTDRQRAILAALARPFANADGLAGPATNQAIAAEVHLSVDAVKGHLRVLYARFGLDELPQQEKRVRLADRALRDGLTQPL